MEIGILSMQRIINYGSFLQAYALKSILEELGHTCTFIDINPGENIIRGDIKAKGKGKINFIIERLDKYLFRRIQRYFYIKKRRERFNKEFFPILGICEHYNYNSDYDAVVIGSDEVFNCARATKWGFAKTLFGEGINADRIITYAASCGNTTLEKLELYRIKNEVEKALQNINTFSVRDENTKGFVEALINRKAIINLDPALIYNFSKEIPDKVQEKDYILVYAYDNRINDKETIQAIKSLGKRFNKKIVSAGVFQKWCDKNILCTPFELLAYFRNADYVVTDTFHGTVFSIKYNKQFVSIIRESNREKLGHLLERFSLTDRELTSLNSLESIINQKYNYAAVNRILMEEAKRTVQYFRENLG